MPIKYIPFVYTAIFSIILVNVVPRKDIHRLFIYGLIFGGIFDVVVVSLANLIGEFKYINYEPFGLIGIHFMAPIAWTVFFIIYFYLLPDKKIYCYTYLVAAIFYSIMFCQMITKLGVLLLAHGIFSSIAPFIIWFPVATWGYLKLTKRQLKN
ncbi:MAG TPA: hypothetical protein VEC37_07165 [Bacillota bacterium]|nr:hypothetical protein [Bacillota bacterium]